MKIIFNEQEYEVLYVINNKKYQVPKIYDVRKNKIITTNHFNGWSCYLYILLEDDMYMTYNSHPNGIWEFHVYRNAYDMIMEDVVKELL